MFEFIKNKVRKMSEKKEAPKKKPVKKEAKKAPLVKKDSMSVKVPEDVQVQKVVVKDYPKNLCLGKDNKTFLTIEESGKMVFNKNDFPGWKVENFAREFVKIVEEISGQLK